MIGLILNLSLSNRTIKMESNKFFLFIGEQSCCFEKVSGLVLNFVIGIIEIEMITL